MEIFVLNFKNGRIGETKLNKYGSEITIIKYLNSRDIVVRFTKENYETTTRYDAFLEGRTKNPYDKTICGVGYLGEGGYVKTKKCVANPIYVTWDCMLRRVYSDKIHKRKPSYIGCSVTEDWHNFQVFAKWYNENYYKIEDQEMQLDKDILLKGNKVYSPETCIFVPQNINKLFVKKRSTRGEYPIGVHYSERYKSLISSCNNNDNSGLPEFLGCYSTPELAFNAYKTYKENIIKQVADKYKNQIPKILYDTMYAYKVEITD